MHEVIKFIADADGVSFDEYRCARLVSYLQSRVNHDPIFNSSTLRYSSTAALNNPFMKAIAMHASNLDGSPFDNVTGNQIKTSLTHLPDGIYCAVPPKKLVFPPVFLEHTFKSDTLSPNLQNRMSVESPMPYIHSDKSIIFCGDGSAGMSQNILPVIPPTPWKP